MRSASIIEIPPEQPEVPGALGAAREFDFLLTLLSVELSPQQIQCVANCDPTQVDWAKLLSLAEHHGVLPIVSRNLIEHAPALPSEIQQRLRLAYEANLRRSLWFAAELTRIMEHFKRRELRAVPYKGPVLAQQVYGDVGLRSFSDLDLLIAPVDFGRAKQALGELGYRASAKLTPTLERFLLQVTYECPFDADAGPNLLELQWALLPNFFAVNFLIEDLLARACSTTISGTEVPCLSPEDCLLALSLHAAKHLWSKLSWLTDIAETLRTQPIDYSVVCSRARSLGVVRILAVSLWLVKNLLPGEVPAGAVAILGTDPAVETLGKRFRERLARNATYDFDSTEYFRLILKLRERRWDRLRTLWRLLWTPGPSEIAVASLPKMLFPLYRVVRIGRLARKGIRGKTRRDQ